MLKDEKAVAIMAFCQIFIKLKLIPSYMYINRQ